MPEDFIPLLYTGTTGWSHQGWNESFYPPQMKPAEYLSYYSTLFNCVEADSTFYKIPSIQLTQSWNEKTPDNFIFCPKIPHTISHEACLLDCQSEVTLFLQSLQPIHHKIGRIILQLPSSCISRHSPLLKKFIFSWPEQFPLAIDFSHPSWIKSQIAHFLKEKNIPWVWTDQTHPEEKIFSALNIHPRTSSDLYIRLIGSPPKKIMAKTNIEIEGEIINDNRNLMIDQWKQTIKNHLKINGRVFCFCHHYYQDNAFALAKNIYCINSPYSIETPPHSSRQMNLPGY